MNRIAEIRKSKGMTQKPLAEALGVEQPAVSKLEREDTPPTIIQLRVIAKTLGVSFGELEEPLPFSNAGVVAAKLVDKMQEGKVGLVLDLLRKIDKLEPEEAGRLVRAAAALFGPEGDQQDQ